MCFEAPDFLKYAARLESFKNWPRIQTPQSLAAAGFFKITQGIDDVQCFYCGIRIYDWLPTDDPLTEHLRWSQHCKFANIINSMLNMNELIDGALTVDQFLGELIQNNACDVIGAVKASKDTGSDVVGNVKIPNDTACLRCGDLKNTKDVPSNVKFVDFPDHELLKTLILLMYKTL